MEETRIIESITVHHSQISEEEKALGAEFNRTAWRALAVANRYLQHGPESARQNIVKSFIGVLSKLSAVDSESELEEHRVAFLAELSSLRAIDATPTQAIPQLTDHQD